MVGQAALLENSLLVMGLKAAFARVDRNGDGKVSRAELILRVRQDGELATALGLPQKITDEGRAAFEEAWRELDVDADDFVTEQEFVRFWMASIARQQELKAATTPVDAAAASAEPSVPTTEVSTWPEAAGEAAAASAAAVLGWQHKLMVLCELAREMIASGRIEPASSVAYRILELDGLMPVASAQLGEQGGEQRAPQPPLVLVAALAKEFAASGHYEPAAALAQRVLKLDASNVEAGGVVRYVRNQAHAWAESSRGHLPGLCVGREHADRAAYAIQSPARAQHGPRPRQPRSGALNPRPGVPQQRPRAGRTIYVLPPRISADSRSASTGRCGHGAGQPLTATPPALSARQRPSSGRPVVSDTKAGAITPQGLRSQQLARHHEMVPISVLLRESSTPKHTTSWVVMDEAAAPIGVEKAEVMLRQAYEIKDEAERLRDENEQLKSQAEDRRRRIELLEANAESSILGTLDKMNAEVASKGTASQAALAFAGANDCGELPDDRAAILQQLCKKQEMENEMGDVGDGIDVHAKRANVFRSVFKVLDFSGAGTVLKRDLLNILRKDATIARLLQIPQHEVDAEQKDYGQEDVVQRLVEQIIVNDDEEIGEEQFVALSTMGLSLRKAANVVNTRNRALTIMSERLDNAESSAWKEVEEARVADQVAAEEMEEARRAQMLADKENFEALLADHAARKEEEEAEEYAALAAREKEEAMIAKRVAEQEEMQAKQAMELAAKEQEEAKAAKEKADAERDDVVKAEKACEVARAALRAVQQSQPQDLASIASAKEALAEAEATLEREQAEYDEALLVAEQEAAEASAAAELAAKEMQEAQEARKIAQKEEQEAREAELRAQREQEEAKIAREVANKERKEADDARQLAEKQMEEAQVAMENAAQERAEADEALANVERVRLENAKLQATLLEQQTESTKKEEQLLILEEQVVAHRKEVEEDARKNLEALRLKEISIWGEVDNDYALPELGPTPIAPAAGSRLVVTIENCSNLIASDSSGTSDPYCLLGIGQPSTFAALSMPKKQHADVDFPHGGMWLRTATVQKNLNPVFDEAFSVPLPSSPVETAEPLVLKILVWDWDRIGANDFLGEIEIDLRKALRYQSGFERTITKNLADPAARVPQADLRKKIDAEVTRHLAACNTARTQGKWDENTTIIQHNLAAGRVCAARLYGQITFKLQYKSVENSTN